jgi:glycosyltransferase involved in cell wall biosynthesis
MSSIGASESELRPLRLSIVFHETAMLGAGVAVARVLPALRQFGWEPSVILPEDGPLVDALSDIDVFTAAPPRPIGVSLRGWRRPPGIRHRVYQSRHFFASVRQGLQDQRPDVVHVNTLHALSEGVIARRLNLPIMLHAHEIPPPSVKRSLAVRGAAALADVIVPVSDTVKALYASAMPASRLMTVYNGVAISPLMSCQDAIVVGTVGSICERKGTDILLEAAGIVKDVRSDVAFEHLGPSVASSEPQFKRKLAELAAGAVGLSFLGPQDVASVLPRWSIFVLPSRQEAFPLATLEAMVVGLPVIASDVGGLPEQIVDGKTGILVPPADPHALARAILDLVGNPGLRRQLGEAARKHVAEFFTYERQAKGLDNAYREALAHHRQRALRRAGAYQ